MDISLKKKRTQGNFPNIAGDSVAPNETTNLFGRLALFTLYSELTLEQVEFYAYIIIHFLSNRYMYKVQTVLLLKSNQLRSIAATE